MPLASAAAGDDSRFRDGFVRDERAFDFGCAETVAADVYHVVHATHNPEVAILVSSRAVAREINAFYLRPVLLAITFVVSPDCPEH